MFRKSKNRDITHHLYYELPSVALYSNRFMNNNNNNNNNNLG